MSFAVSISGGPRPVRRSPWLCAAAALAALAFAAPLVEHAFGLGALYSYKVLVPFIVAALAVAWLAERQLGPREFGPANQVTLARACGVALLVGLLGETPTPGLAWFAAAAALVVLILDGVDGRLARACGASTRFGARFDMETDALLVLILSLLVVQFDKAAAYVLAAGFMRYAFAAAAALVPRLRGALPPSRRRQAVCVAQVAALAVCLVPWLARPVSEALALVSVAALCASFAVDLRWLAKAGGAAPR